MNEKNRKKEREHDVVVVKKKTTKEKSHEPVQVITLLTLMLKSIFGASQVTNKESGWPWKAAPWARIVRG